MRMDHQRTSSLSESSVPQLSFTSSQLLALHNSQYVIIDSESLQEGNGFLGLFNGFEFVINNKGEFGYLLNLVASGQDERSASTGSNGGSGGMSPLLDVDLTVPSSPGLDGCEHSTFTAHVTEGTLTTSAGSTSTNTGDTGNGSTGSPRSG